MIYQHENDQLFRSYQELTFCLQSICEWNVKKAITHVFCCSLLTESHPQPTRSALLKVQLCRSRQTFSDDLHTLTACFEQSAVRSLALEMTLRSVKLFVPPFH